jgi:hypothetical protein
MGGLFGGSQPSAPPPPPPPPTDNSAAVQNAEKEQRVRMASAGRASTMLTGGSGVEEDVQTAKKKLLGS